MSFIKRNKYSTEARYNTVYTDMRGVDFSGDGSGISRNRFAYLENMYRDYEGDGAGAPESIPGFRKIARFTQPINGLFSSVDKNGDTVITVHSAGSIFQFKEKELDSLDVMTPVCSARNSQSRAFCQNDSLFILDGKSIIRISDEYAGEISDTGGGVYIPTTYINGKSFEQRNLLTRRFCESTVFGSADYHVFATPTLKYVITDPEKLTCKVVGANGDESEIHIPGRIKIADTYYSVTEIDAKSFQGNIALKELYVSLGVKVIGRLAFSRCTALEKVVLPDTVHTLSDAAFADCTSLSYFHLGAGCSTLGNALFSFCSNLTNISYSGTESTFAAIEGLTVLGDRSISYEENISYATVGIDIYSPCVSVEAVRINGSSYSFEVLTENGLCKSVKVRVEDKTQIDGKEAVIEGTLSAQKSDYGGIHSGFMASSFAGSGDVSSVIKECTVAETFDGKIFLTGNPRYPGISFYSANDRSGKNNPLYFGELNYFVDGTGKFANTALLAAGDSLAVFKEGDDGGSIFYHTPRETGIDIIPKIYPVSYIHSGVCTKGGVISFFDDPLFVTENGISALSKKQINLERSIVTRSKNVNPKLLSESLDKVMLSVWRGYLVVAAGAHIYLADSRMTFIDECGNMEYEWYYLNGIGTHFGHRQIYRYSSVPHREFDKCEEPDEIADGEVKNVIINHVGYCYVEKDGKRYEVYPTNEYTGGAFSPLCKILSVGEHLFFATECGDICVFNNDKRGVLPKDVASVYPDGGKGIYGKRIHPYYYSFDGHAPRYAVSFKKDDCGIPHLEKNTVKQSLVIKCRALSSGTLRCECGSDNVGYSEIAKFPNADIFFADIDFANMTFITDDTYTVPLGDKTKGFIEKQISVYSDEDSCPFGIYTAAYRFTVKGRIKKNRKENR